MTDNDKLNHEINVLLEEYRQVYSQARHADNLSQSKEAIFAIAAFGVFALVLDRNLSIYYLIGAGIVSMALYLFHIFSCERIFFNVQTAFTKLRDIEERINKLAGDDILNYQTKYLYWKSKTNKEHRKWFGIRDMRLMMALLLAILWATVFVFRKWLS